MKKAIIFSTITLFGLIFSPHLQGHLQKHRHSVPVEQRSVDGLVNPEETEVKPAYEFYGRHLILNFKGCDIDALLDEQQLKEVMKRAVEASNATILSSNDYTFDPHGLTMVFLLSESHASIHTYPEHRGCFIDLFTCGTSCDEMSFEDVLADYLKPEHIDRMFIERS